MRLRSLLLAILLLTPVAMADQGSDDGSSDGDDDSDADRNETRGQGADKSDRSGRGDGSLADACRDRDDRRECVQDYCKRHGGEECAQKIREACDGGDCPALARACADPRNDRQEKLCDRLGHAEDVRQAARHIDFSVDREGRALRNYSIDGTVVFAAIEYSDNATDFEVDRNGARIRFETDDSRLEIHDTPTGQFWYRSDEAPLHLVLADGVTAKSNGVGIILDVDGRLARLVGTNLSMDDAGIMVDGHASFTFPVAGSARSDGVEAARASQKLGAEIDVAAGDDGVVAYDDVNVTVSGDVADGLRVVVSADLSSGRTFVLDIDPEQLSGPDLNLSYYDVNDDGSETEVVFRMASSMQDALDPDDDGGQPEYWVFEDADGLHVMVSVPHWSTHVIELQSLGVTFVQPSVLLGMLAGVAAVGVAAVAMFRPRRD